MRTSAAPSTKELVKRAKGLNAQAEAASSPEQATQYRKEACGVWLSAYQSSKKPDLLVETGRCKQEAGDLTGAENDFRTFLVEVSPSHPARIIVEGLAEEVAQRRQQAALSALEPELIQGEPLLVEDSPAQRKRRFWLMGGGVLGVGGVVGIVAGFVLRAQPPSIPEGKGGAAELIP